VFHYRLAADDPEEPTRPTTITRDPAGPLLVRGDLVLNTPDGLLRDSSCAVRLRPYPEPAGFAR
jgi:hypothetical protein